MQNEKCIMHNCGVPSARFKTISEGNTFILHFAFYILHLPEGQVNDNLPFFLRLTPFLISTLYNYRKMLYSVI